MDIGQTEGTNLDIFKKGEIVLYEPDSSIRLEVRMENETVWLNRQQMAILKRRTGRITNCRIFCDSSKRRKSCGDQRD